MFWIQYEFTQCKFQDIEYQYTEGYKKYKSVKLLKFTGKHGFINLLERLKYKENHSLNENTNF